MCHHCSAKGKPCPNTPKVVALPTGYNLPLANVAGLVCGQTKSRGDDELIVLCEDCVVACWCEHYPVIQKFH